MLSGFQKTWKNKKFLLVLMVALTLITVSLSLFLSLIIAQNQAISKESRYLRDLSDEVRMRLSINRKQFSIIVNHFSGITDNDACSPEQVEKMQEFTVSAVFLQAIGHIKNNKIVCSSISGVFDGVQLGEPSRVEQDGTRVWSNIKIANWQNQHFVILEKSGWAIMFLPTHIIEALNYSKIAIGIFGIKSHRLYANRGRISPGWIENYHGGKALNFIDKKRNLLVYISPNNLNYTAVVTAMPLENANNDIAAFVQVLIPLAIVIGLILGGLFMFLQRTRYSTRSEIQRALLNNEFYLEYQPIIDLKSKACVGAEALIRWKTRENKLISPDVFIPAAEVTGIICEITKRVFEIVARDMHNLFKSNPDFHIAINISSHDIRSGNLLALIQNLKQATGAQENQIVIEVTERGMLDDKETLDTIREIRQCGALVAIDDFGTGYSSLSYLTKFQLDYLKIDKAFVDSVGADTVTSHVAFHIIEMAKSLKLDMIAEGVETEEQAKILEARGVKHVQGWLFSKSLNIKDFYCYLELHSSLRH